MHVGCTSSPGTEARWKRGTLLHWWLCEDAKGTDAQVVGIDIDRSSIKFLREKIPDAKILEIDAQELDEHFSSEDPFDLIIAGDVIEHLPCPGAFIESCRTVLLPSGTVLITTVNAFGISRFLKTIFNHEAVHDEHTAYYSWSTLHRLCIMSGFKVLSLGYYKCEPMRGWSLNLMITNAIEHLTTWVWPQWSEGIVAQLVKFD